jgi:mannose-1-phosphate guanylyltransferase/mannose-6-phosphate isomerase
MADFSDSVFPVLLAGGSGTRLWPVSRELYPKQLVKFIGNDSMIQATVKRLLPVLDAHQVRIVCGRQHAHEIARHLGDIGIPPDGKIYAEPSGRNTAPAILLAAFQVRHINPEAVMCIFPADHVIADNAAFLDRLAAAVRLAGQDYIVTFGITPNYPETGYGYVEGEGAAGEGALNLKRFVEKPDAETARSYVDAGNFFWNSGMFAFKVAVILDEFRRHRPGMLDTMEEIFDSGPVISVEDYNRLEDISIDYAIMEKTARGVVLPSSFGWSDIGSWKALYDFLPKDAEQNVIDGDVITQETRNCFISGFERLIATNGVSDLVIVETPDSIFVSDIDRSRDVKSIVQELKQKNRRETRLHRKVFHPWGTSTLLDENPNCRVERVEVYPGSSWRSARTADATQHLTVVRGTAELVTGGKTTPLTEKDAHSFAGEGRILIENTGSERLQLVCVQIGGVIADSARGAGSF